MNEDDIKNFIDRTGVNEPWKVKVRINELVEAIKTIRNLCLGYGLKECKDIVEYYHHSVKKGIVTVLVLANGNKLHITNYQQGWKTELYCKPQVSTGESESELFRLIQVYAENNVPRQGPTA